MMNYYLKLSHVKEIIKKNAYYKKVVLIGLILLTATIVLFLYLNHRRYGDSCPEEIVPKYHYSQLKQQDVSGKDFMHVQNSDKALIQRVCDLFVECAAYNSNGWLKRSDVSQHSLQANLYVKQKSVQSQCKASTSDPMKSEFSDMMSNMKIFIYPTTVGTSHRPHRYGGYAVERIFVEALNRSPFLTSNGKLATFYFIPIRCSSYIITASSEHHGVIQAKQLVGEMLEEIKTKFPYWSWSNGADHFFICAHEIGAGIGDGALKNAIALVNTADYDDPYFIPHKDITLPPSPSSSSNGKTLLTLKGGQSISQEPRSFLAFYAGDLQSGRIRPSLYNRWSDDKEIILFTRKLEFSAYLDHLKHSKYCLIVRGKEVWSPRLVEAIYAGCVPVIISDHYHLPLHEVLNWKEFSVIVPESEIFQLKTILKDISTSKYFSMQKKLTQVYSYFVWNTPPVKNDAFYSIMLQLWRRRHVVQYRSALSSL